MIFDRSWCERRVVSSPSLVVFTDPLDFSPSPTILDAIPLSDVDGVRAIIGEGDNEPSLHRRPISFPHVSEAITKAGLNYSRTEKSKGSSSWVDSLPRVGGGNRFSNTVEIRYRLLRRTCNSLHHKELAVRYSSGHARTDTTAAAYTTCEPRPPPNVPGPPSPLLRPNSSRPSART